MATHVVVIDSTARKATIKVTPGTPLSDVLQEGCSKLGYNSSQFGLKHNKKQVDLSRTIRLSGLPSGAKLELVQLSKSAGVVSVALQIPVSEAQGTPNARLTDKFPSTTTLWLVLRKFEAGVAGGGPKRNFTARGIPSTTTGSSGAGRLYYEQPVLNIMGRDLSSFTDLQKSLAQIGFNSGSALIRLNFQPTQQPLEEAMAQIQEYFDSVDGPTMAAAPAIESTSAKVEPEWTHDGEPEGSEANGEDTVMQNATPPESSTSTSGQADQPAPQSSEVPAIAVIAGQRPVSVFRPPSSSSPSAAQIVHKEADYVPTVEHAQAHQKMLQEESRNRRLPTDAELEAQAKEQAEKLAAVRDVEIKIRFPDQSAVSSKFVQGDSAAELYGFVRDCLDARYRSELFVLRNPGVKGKGEIIDDNPNQQLIKNLGLKGRVLVVFSWDDAKTSVEARGAKSVLKQELRNQAQEYQAPSIPELQDSKDDPGTKVNLSKPEPSGTGDGEGKKKLPKWLKGLGKK